jgi:hypothetical protein
MFFVFCCVCLFVFLVCMLSRMFFFVVRMECLFACKCVCMYVYMYVYMCVCMYVYICVCVCVCFVCVCVLCVASLLCFSYHAMPCHALPSFLPHVYAHTSAICMYFPTHIRTRRPSSTLHCVDVVNCCVMAGTDYMDACNESAFQK